MKNLKSGIAILALGAFVTTVASCDKEDEFKPTTVCRVSSVVNTGSSTTTTTTIAYDEGRIASITVAGGTGGTKLFSYSGNMITIINKNGQGIVSGTDEITLNTDDKITSINKKNALGVSTAITSYSYGLDGNLIQFVYDPSVGSSDTSSVYFSNGNVATIVDAKGNETNYEYYTNKTFLDGDYVKIIQMTTNGALSIENMNLVKSITKITNGKPETTNFSYDYSSFDKITRLTATGGSALNYSYTYDCE